MRYDFLQPAFFSDVQHCFLNPRIKKLSLEKGKKEPLFGKFRVVRSHVEALERLLGYEKRAEQFPETASSSDGEGPCVFLEMKKEIDNPITWFLEFSFYV
ncbi:hypothetical protein TNCV_1918891 [Trichonephila clavipes]|nr:hypothetical protein TNCV_1918891 [Trichonephila clavipes]